MWLTQARSWLKTDDWVDALTLRSAIRVVGRWRRYRNCIESWQIRKVCWLSLRWWWIQRLNWQSLRGIALDLRTARFLNSRDLTDWGYLWTIRGWDKEFQEITWQHRNSENVVLIINEGEIK